LAESQNIEYKSSWRDEYIKWICGFANASGGTMFIGMDDVGEVVGLDDSKRLMEDIPNKVRDILGILVDVDLGTKDHKTYIKITVDSHPYPVSYKGQYHFRSGTTKQELKGAALDKFLLNKSGKKWDGVPVPYVTIADLKKETLEFFKNKASLSQRGTDTVLTDPDEVLLENLHLSENSFLKRAAILLFHPEPQKIISGSYIKIGFFKSDDDLVFQDEIRGNLFEQVENTMKLLFSKYFKALIRYDKLQRIEEYEYPYAAVREALLNAVAHKDYAGYTPIQISIYEDFFMIWNEGQLPDRWTVDKLLVKHPSIPFNPDIANAFFRSGYIESWGRGTLKMIKECEEYHLPNPEFKYDMSGFFVRFHKYKYDATSLQQLGLNGRQIECILVMMKERTTMTNQIYQNMFAISKRTAGNDLKQLVDDFGLLSKSNTKGPGLYYSLK
jgi:ATP-dependent DNA helicase RecG